MGKIGNVDVFLNRGNRSINPGNVCVWGAVTEAGLNSLRGICCIRKLALACFDFHLFGNQPCFIALAGTIRGLSRKHSEASGDAKSLEQGGLGSPRRTVSALYTETGCISLQKGQRSTIGGSFLFASHPA